jgi:adenylate cyclase
MPANIEVKVRLHEPEEMAARVKAVAGEPTAVFSQEDVFFQVPRGRLKMRLTSDSEAEFIYYQRVNQPGPRYSGYFSYRPADSARVEAELSTLFGIKGSVKKKRRLFWLEGARIHLDEVDGLGQFLEVEVPISHPSATHRASALAEKIIARLGIRSSDFEPKAYEELLAM